MKKNCDTLIQADWILTQDKHRTTLENSGLAITNGVITEVDTWDVLTDTYQARQQIRLKKSLVLPGLINTHTHSPMTLFRGLADDMPLKEWLTTCVWPLEGKLTAELITLGSQLACAEMIRTGTTCFTDLYFLQQHTARVVEECGLRAVLSEGVLAFPTPSYQSPEQAYEIIESQFEQFKNHERVSFALTTHSVPTTTPEILAKTFEMAEKHNTIWMTHLAETEQEIEDCVALFGKPPLQCLDDMGILGPRCLLAHGVHFSDAELDRVAESGAKIAHNPRSNMKLGSGIAPLHKFLDRGISTSLGTDGAASNNTLNMFQEMNTCALLHKAASQNATTAAAPLVLDMATLGGAANLGMDHVGSLEPGKKADLIALDLTQPNLMPLHDAVSHVVYAANGSEVRLNMVGGKVLFQDGEFTTMDYACLAKQAGTVRAWAQNALNA